MTFAPGDVVFLKSGGQPMTLIAADDDEAECIWTGDDGDLFRETIPTVALQTAHQFEADEVAAEADAEQAVPAGNALGAA